MIVPRSLVDACVNAPERSAWLQRIPELVESCARRWSVAVEVDRPFDASAAWVAPAVRGDGTPVILKLIMPHMEADHEIDGLRFWAGDPTIELLEFDGSCGAMLLERCLPGYSLQSMGDMEQDEVIATLLRQLWRPPGANSVFRPLATMITSWCGETVADSSRWPDVSLIEHGLSVFNELIRSSSGEVLLATDLHAGNALRAERRPWLVIDPKPFVGDPAYDATQHLLNHRLRLRRDVGGLIARFADLLSVDVKRVRLWTFARLAAEPREVWDADSLALARAIRP